MRVVRNFAEIRLGKPISTLRSPVQPNAPKFPKDQLISINCFCSAQSVHQRVPQSRSSAVGAGSRIAVIHWQEMNSPSLTFGHGVKSDILSLRVKGTPDVKRSHFRTDFSSYQTAWSLLRVTHRTKALSSPNRPGFVTDSAADGVNWIEISKT